MVYFDISAGDLSARGPKCFSCPESVVPESCRHTQNCDVDEVKHLVAAIILSLSNTRPSLRKLNVLSTSACGLTYCLGF